MSGQVDLIELNQELFDKIKDRIIYELNYWNKEHNPDNINLDLNLYSIGLDRSDVVTICCEFEDTFKKDIPIERIEKLETIKDLYNYFNGGEKDGK